MLKISPIRFTQPNYKPVKTANSQTFKGSESIVLSKESIQILDKVIEDSERYFGNKTRTVFSKYNDETKTLARITRDQMYDNLYSINVDSFPLLRMKMDIFLNRGSDSKGKAENATGAVRNFIMEINSKKHKYNEPFVDSVIFRNFGPNE